MSTDSQSFGGFNQRADYKYKIGLGQKANGEIQVKEITLRSDVLDGLVDSTLQTLVDVIDAGKKKKLRMVSSTT